MSMSNRTRRMLTHQIRNKADAELNLIPMIDILSVMVSFLLIYSTEVEVVQNNKGIEVPESIAETKPRQTIVVMLTKDELFVQGVLVAKIDDIRNSSTALFAPLATALKQTTLVGTILTDKDLKDREVTVMADKTLPYEILKKVMSTATDADYGRISLAVIQADKPVSAETAEALRK